MDKKTIPLAVALFALLMFWPQICAKYFPTPDPPVPPPAPTETAEPAAVATSAPPAMVTSDLPVAGTVTSNTPPPATGISPAAVAEEPQHASDKPELTMLSNDLVDITVSSWGGGIVTATLKEYPQENRADSPPVVLDFSAMPTLSFDGIAGLSTNHDFGVTSAGKTFHVTRQTDHGLRLDRTIELTDSYEIKVIDKVSNTGATPLLIPEFGLHIGPMRKVDNSQMRRTFVYLGIDSQLTHGGDDLRHWGSGRKLEKSESSLVELFQEDHRRGGGCNKPAMTKRLPAAISHRIRRETDWLAVKNKYFAQILTPATPSEDPGCSAFVMRAAREVSEAEELRAEDGRAWDKKATLQEVNATMVFPAHSRPLEPGQSSSREMSYYVGPKKYDMLKDLGKTDVMEFGFWSPVCQLLLPFLNKIYTVVPNYGWAIIILTILIRVVFFPIMKRQTDTMKKMQEVQPQLKVIREKYKDDQQELYKRQQALFKEHGVSPMGGCLPMLIQIPVFIGLLTVLRSAIELRFASWLWIKDLSASEGLLAGHIPLVGELNILPLLMTATMIWQQKLTPSTGDQQQQKMMMIMMPMMMLMFFYKMPSASVLYFTVSQCLGIAQLLIRTRGDKKKKAVEG